MGWRMGGIGPIGRAESQDWQKAQMLALRAGIRILERDKDILIQVDGDVMHLCTPSTPASRGQETWSALARRYPLLAAF